MRVPSLPSPSISGAELPHSEMLTDEPASKAGHRYEERDGPLMQPLSRPQDPELGKSPGSRLPPVFLVASRAMANEISLFGSGRQTASAFSSCASQLRDVEKRGGG